MAIKKRNTFAILLVALSALFLMGADGTGIPVPLIGGTGVGDTTASVSTATNFGAQTGSAGIVGTPAVPGGSIVSSCTCPPTAQIAQAPGVVNLVEQPAAVTGQQPGTLAGANIGTQNGTIGLTPSTDTGSIATSVDTAAVPDSSESLNMSDTIDNSAVTPSVDTGSIATAPSGSQ